ncbi:hypothetical protein VT930_11875 [Mycobacterium sherrisii]|uniref:hypothetical protein n=1 Tax=Mycobacterium sherrisii TaxID=243061 RepID=UPI002DDC9DB2|nr:hypothetical protein [Mycobacterium sherrisii]MEC4763802.1 hypothetical protein [Mycobacterium sherrisii]
MDGARYVLLWGDGVERFTDERDRSARAWQLHAAGHVTAQWVERTLPVLVRLPGDEFADFDWDFDSTAADVRAAFPTAIGFAFPDETGDYDGPWLTVPGYAKAVA